MSKKKSAVQRTKPKRSDKQTLQSVDAKLDDMLSYKKVFLRGIIRGLGVFVGATIIATLSLSLASWLANGLDKVPLIGDFIDTSAVDELID